MSNKKSKNMKKLDELKETAINLENEIKQVKKENLKISSIRNLKIFGKTVNFLVPFVLATGITIGGMAFLEGGLPFYKDDVTKYKVHSLDYQTKAYTIETESYESKLWHDSSLDTNKLVVYTPWQYENNQYVRYKRSYDVKITNYKEAFDAVKNNNYKYIEEKIVEPDEEEKQIVNSIDFVSENDYVIIASLHMMDKSDLIKYKETDVENLIMTIIDLVLGLGIGGLAAWARKFEYFYEVKQINSEYKLLLKPLKPLKEKLKQTNIKIKKIGAKNEK